MAVYGEGAFFDEDVKMFFGGRQLIFCSIKFVLCEWGIEDTMNGKYSDTKH